MNQPELETLGYKPNCKTCEDTKMEWVGHGHTRHEAPCRDCKPEQPNTNAMLIKTIQNLMHVITNNLEKLPDEPLRRMALDDIGVFEAGLLYKLQEEYA